MEKRYQVFVSSTFEDLQEERREVMQALLKMDCIPTGMELFPAADDDSLTLIRRFIAECDYYIVIIGGRYGSIGPDGRSYTEMEYDFAVEAGIPILPFIHGEPSRIIAGRTEATDQGRAALAAFRKKLEAKRHFTVWTSPKDLAGCVCLAMMSLIKLKPRIGWVRADRVPDESVALEILRLTNSVYSLQREISQLVSQPPAGSEELAQGEESIDLHFRFEYRNEFSDAVENFTWKEIVALLGPVMLFPATEDVLKTTLANAFKNRVKDKENIHLFNAYIRAEDFQRVKVQLKALGLITKAKEDANAWILTPYGDTLMTQIAAIRSKTVIPDYTGLREKEAIDRS